MAKVRNIGPKPVMLVCITRTVDIDEVVDVPDEVFARHGWPEELWEVLSEGNTTNKDEE